MRRTLEQRLLSKTLKSMDGCWIWTGAWDGDLGYGRITVDNRTRLTHRVAYELWTGPIPEGMKLDHLCRTPACIRPTHLEPVTNAENVLRGLGSYSLIGRCRSGRHDVTNPANIYHRGDGYRQCLPCRKLARAAWYAARKAGGK